MSIKSILKDGVFEILDVFSSRDADRASILMYHSVGHNKAFFTVTPEIFEKQMQVLCNGGYKVISLSELLKRIKNKESLKKCVVITFDDGYLDNYENAFPILKKFNFPACIFLVTGLLGKELTNSEGISLPLLNEQQINEMTQAGIEFMPHTRTHRELVGLSESELNHEIEGSKVSFAYPRGKYDLSTLDFLTAKGWESAVTVEAGSVSNTDSLLTLKRNSVDSSTSLVQFNAKINGTIDLYQKLKGIL